MIRRSPRLTLALLLGLLMLTTLAAAHLGALRLSPVALLRDSDPLQWQIWLNIRLPRVLLAAVIGIALAVSGTLMQGLFRNPLADPALLGISSGAALCVALTIVLPLALSPLLALYAQMLAAFGGSLAISLLIYLLSRGASVTLSRLLLAGIAINALCFALVGVLSYLSDDQQLRQFTLWSMGTLSRSEWHTLGASALLILPASLFALTRAQRLNLLQLGDEEAHYLGLDVARTKRQLLLLSAILVGSAVAVSGVIGFIGLVIPHLFRLRLGADHRWLLPCAALGGACLLLLADTLARTLAAPAEMPVGMLTSLLGGPYFLWLILRYREVSHGQ
ncbi:FecCD family ABC transporter permease [Edwardsiella anguillarum]|uniref:Hemin ABC transporter, permease protein n=2 Tax=Edwardsiella anguillarum TaxID=1821960 RepID=A0A076LXW3_9GAMM|nr:iron ABC transporter permease [Edwardsiella anguillarum]AIJ10254.1 Hemin ABC transporter, permease protein [Edwardsiella anguillarum ET080813]KAB0592080.1 iron ABC transporter permease [Edwardsiella anguillarum]UOU77477.1 iron ABC transporter permease [Edwardsiella anguillarum]WHP85670.1 iron ABC transporter permease [Edwardsiella anguillarum]WHP89451.1 iron ABC transporter permease [Edwardsiella anguillarum]